LGHCSALGLREEKIKSIAGNEKTDPIGSDEGLGLVGAWQNLGDDEVAKLFQSHKDHGDGEYDNHKDKHSDQKRLEDTK